MGVGKVHRGCGKCPPGVDKLWRTKKSSNPNSKFKIWVWVEWILFGKLELVTKGTTKYGKVKKIEVNLKKQRKSSHLLVAPWKSGSQLACQAIGALPQIDTMQVGGGQTPREWTNLGERWTKWGQGHLAQAACTSQPQVAQKGLLPMMSVENKNA